MTTLGMSERSILADSAPFFTRCMAMGDWARSTLCWRQKSSSTKSMIRLSKSTPPRKVSPPVASTSNTFAGELQHRDVEGAAAQVVDQDLLVEPAREPVGQRRRGGLVDDALHVEAGQPARPPAPPGAARRSSRPGTEMTAWSIALLQEGLGDLLHVGEDHGADLRQGADLAPEEHRRLAVRPLHDVVGVVVAQLLDDLGVPLAADEPLGAVDGVLGVDDELVLGHRADQDVALLAERHHGGEDEAPAVGRHHPRDAAADVGDAGVGGAEVDPDDGLLAVEGHGASILSTDRPVPDHPGPGGPAAIPRLPGPPRLLAGRFGLSLPGALGGAEERRHDPRVAEERRAGGRRQRHLPARLVELPALEELRLARQLLEEARRLEDHPLPVAGRGHHRIGEVELVLGPGAGDVEEAALLLLARRVLEGLGRGEAPVGEPHHEDRAPLQALGLVDAGEHHLLVRLPSLGHRLGGELGEQRDLGQEGLGVLVAAGVLGELLHVLDAGVGVQELGAQVLLVAAVQHLLDGLAGQVAGGRAARAP